MNNNNIIKKLSSMEDMAKVGIAHFQNMLEECHTTRLLLEGSVSTLTRKSKVDTKKVAAIVSKRLQKIYQNKSC